MTTSRFKAKGWMGASVVLLLLLVSSAVYLVSQSLGGVPANNPNSLPSNCEWYPDGPDAQDPKPPLWSAATLRAYPRGEASFALLEKGLGSGTTLLALQYSPAPTKQVNKHTQLKGTRWIDLYGKSHDDNADINQLSKGWFEQLDKSSQELFALNPDLSAVSVRMYHRDALVFWQTFARDPTLFNRNVRSISCR